MGFAAVSRCNGDNDFLPAPAYGVPVATFEVRCTVVDKESGAPVSRTSEIMLQHFDI